MPSRACSNGPAGTSPASSTTTTPARRSRISRGASRRASPSCARGRGRFPRAATTASTFARSRRSTSRRIRTIRTAAMTTPCVGSPSRSFARSRTSTCRRSASSSTSTSSRARSTRTARSTTTVGALVASGHTYEQDGALFLRTTEFGDDKDRVMRRSAARGGDYTYFLPDVAYHVDKWGRGYRRAINVQGADHHSTVTRVRAGLQALGMGIPEGYPEYALHQMVTVMREGQEVKFSKRAGDIVTVRDLVEWVGRDAVRYFYLMLKPESQLRFDVDLARTPVGREPDLPHPDGARADVRHLPPGRDRSVGVDRREHGGPRGARHDGGARAGEEAGGLPVARGRARRRRSNRTAWRRTCWKPPAWRTSGITSITCWISPSRCEPPVWRSPVRRRSCSAMR